MQKEKIILAGGSGFLGQGLVQYFLENGYEVIILSRKKITSDNLNLKFLKWDGKTLGKWAESLENAQAMINLVGRSVNCRYNKKNKAAIYSSRLESTAIIGEAIQKCENPPKVWFNSASATIYRHALDKPMDEVAGEFGEGFSVDVCQKWEETFHSIPTPKTRRIVMRLAMVLGKNGGVMKPFQNLVKLGLGGTQGKGNQFISWLHEKDFHRMIQWFLNNEHISGTFNLSAPNPIPNKDFMQKMRQVYNQPLSLPATEWMLEIGAFFMRTETELITKSRRVIPQKLLDLGFKFDYPTIDDAFENLILGKEKSLEQTLI